MSDVSTGRLSALNPAQRRRLWFVEYNLYWYGEVRRGDVMQAYPVSENTVRSDLRLYTGYLGRPLDSVAGRGYQAPADFQPILYRPNAERFLFALASAEGIPAPYAHTMRAPDEDVSAQELAEELTHRRRRARIVAEAPPELERSRIEPACLRHVIQAIRRKEEILVTYKSPNSPDEQDFWIAPHALANDSFRWTARCWRTDRNRFGDVVLDRLHAVKDRAPTRARAEEDKAWNTPFEVVLGPNPGLSRDARRQIERQYAMRHGKLRVPMRQCFVVYFLKRYQIEEPGTLKAPHQEPLVVLNRDEVTQAIPPWMRLGKPPR